MSEVLERVHKVLRETIAPNAQAMDSDVEVLRQALEAFAREGLLCLRRPAEFGGPEVDQATFRTFQELVARYSGTFAFLQTQHQSAVAMIATSPNEELKRRLLPKVGTIEGCIGIGFSQLRRIGYPIMRAKEVDGGFDLEGHVPWVTGYGFYPQFLVGAQLPDGRAVFAVVPFHEVPNKISISPTMKLAAMEAAQTVTMDFHNFFVPESDVVFIRPQGWIHDNDMINVTLQGYFALGCAQAGIDIVREAFAKKGMPFLERAAEKLEAELSDCRSRLAQLDEPLEERLSSRSKAIDLAARCAHAGVIVSSGAANSVNHPAQRVYREALVFSVSAQTTPIMEASLERLIERGQV